MVSGRRRMVIGLAGKVGSGKTTMAEFLRQQFGFTHLRTRDVLARLLDERGVAVDETSLQELGAELVAKRGPEAVSELVVQSCASDENYVLDSVRHVRECAYLREALGPDFRLAYVVAPEDVRRERYLTRPGRDATEQSFQSRTGHSVESDVPNLLEVADAALVNLDIEDAAAQLAALVLKWTRGTRPTALREMVEAVTEFHRKHGFDIGTADPKVMQYRMGLLVEELGEINECLSKRRGNISEEHADLFILLLGNCITMNINLEAAFWKKYLEIMKRPARRVGGSVRVSHWRTGTAVDGDYGYFHVDLARLLRGDDEPDDRPPASSQLSLFG